VIGDGKHRARVPRQLEAPGVLAELSVELLCEETRLQASTVSRADRVETHFVSVLMWVSGTHRRRIVKR